jgi:galactokinase
MSQERKNKIYRAAVPGRVNLIGEWIDFNGGTVLPMALKRSVRLEMRPNNEEKDRVSSAQYEDLAFIDCNAPAQEHWSDYVRGSLQYARARGWSNQSPFFADEQVSGSDQLAPFEKSGVA